MARIWESGDQAREYCFEEESGKGEEREMDVQRRREGKRDGTNERSRCSTTREFSFDISFSTIVEEDLPV